ncbi:sialate O-acetylesterase [Mucilaginibacter sp. UYP25]|uniref:sialate O-acetylesterase n=1 Tax=unclassified Mucilaginibacter TaxID=2617802 RepID=UPI003396F66F
MFKALPFFCTICFLVQVGFAQPAKTAAGNPVTFKVNQVLQSNMVIQQNKPFKVWGDATAGNTVSVKADWMVTGISVTANADNKFLAIIPVPEARPGDFTAHQISVQNGTLTIVLSNLLVGDVWFLSGQSNMQFPMKEVKDAASEVAKAQDANIRILNVGFNWNTKPIDTIKGEWQVCSPETVKEFSGVGYYFGKGLQNKLNIPIGLIYTGIGGSWEQAYVAQDVMAADTMLNRAYLKPFFDDPKSKEKLDGVFSFDRVYQPFLIHNAMIYPFYNLSIKGICWYQGESNRAERDSYLQLSYAQIKSWRKAFSQGDLPFYYVQVAPHAYGKMDSTLNDYAFFREVQEKVSKMENTAMVVTMDVGDAKNIHPIDKKPVGDRLARTALNRTYGVLSVNYEGPHVDHVQFLRKIAIINFIPSSIKSGLRTNDGSAPKYFMLAGEDHKFYPADAKINGNIVELIARQVKKPVAVRYAFTNYPVTNFENGDGLPAVPFRTDDWPEPVIVKK